MPWNPLRKSKLNLRDERSISLANELFDSAWYLERYPHAIRALEKRHTMTALEHYLSVGEDGRDGTPFFDAAWYLATYPHVAQSALAEGHSSAGKQRFFAFCHYLRQGVEEHYNPSPIFDEHWYESEYDHPNRDHAFANNYHHFLAVGSAAGLNPSPLFDEVWYRERYKDVAGGIEEGLLKSAFHDYMRRPPGAERDPNAYFKANSYKASYKEQVSGRRLAYVDYLGVGANAGNNPSLHFDESWYRNAYAGVYSAVGAGQWRSGYHHYLYEGALRGFAPNPYFLPDWYVNWYPQVKASLARQEFKYAFEHYLRVGAAQLLSPNPWFDEAWYLQHGPDVKAAVAAGDIESGHYHYLTAGARETRIGSTVFDSSWYLETYPEASEFIDGGLANSAYDHFCRYGRKTLCSTCADFDERGYRAAYPDVEEQIRGGLWVDGLHHFVAAGLLEGRLPKQNALEDTREQNAAVSELARLEFIKFLSGTERLVFTPSSNPSVSILLILYNKPELTLRCLRSIQRWADVPCEIVIVDNASGDSTLALLNRIDGATIVRNERNLHFLRAANQGSEMARGKYLLFLNNDSELQVGALSSAVEIFERESDVGAVGAKIILNSGVLQEAGSYFLENGFSTQFGRGKLPFQSDTMHRRDVPYCSGAFLMTPTSLFAECGRFDPVFMPAYSEDADYCLRLWQQGFRVVFNPGSIILHHETGSSPYRRFLYPSVLRNIAIFRHRYSEYLSMVPDYGIAPVSSLDGLRMRRSYLILVESIPRAAADDKLKSMIAELRREKFFVTLYPLQRWAGFRSGLCADIPDEVEVVAEIGQEQLADFCRGRVFYSGVVIVGESLQFSGALADIRQWLPETEVFWDFPAHTRRNIAAF
jgi:GT2 family glycosyltransferase